MNRLHFLVLAMALCSCGRVFAQPAPASATPPSFVMFDQVVTRRGQHQLFKNWDFITHPPLQPGTPTDWTQGGEHSVFNTGIYHFRIEVRRMERAWDSPMTLQFGWWNILKDPDIRHIASPDTAPRAACAAGPGPALGLRAHRHRAGARQGLHVLWRRPEQGQESHRLGLESRVRPDSFYTLIRPQQNQLDKDGDGKISEAEYPDIEFRAVLTIHSDASPVHAFLPERIKDYTTPAVSFAALPAQR
jgi:hypothetical protein